MVYAQQHMPWSRCPWTDDTKKVDTLPDFVVACAHRSGVVQGSLTAALPALVDVTTRDWLRSGMTVQLLQVRTSPVTPVNSTAGPSACEGGTQVSEQCIARGVLQPDALLDEETREWSSRLSLGKEVPLFDAKGVRLGVHSSATGDTDQVCTDTATWPWCVAMFAFLAPFQSCPMFPALLYYLYTRHGAGLMHSGLHRHGATQAPCSCADQLGCM